MFLGLRNLPFRHLGLIIQGHVEDLRHAEHLSGKSGDKHGDRSCCWEQKSIWRRSSQLGGTQFSTHNPRPLEEANTATRSLWLRCDGLETHAEDAIFTPTVCVGLQPSTPAVTMWFWHSNHCQESRTLSKASVTKDKDPVRRYYSSVPFQTASVLWTSFKKARLKWTKGGFPFKPTSTSKSRKEKSQPCFRLHKLMVRVEVECPSPLQRRNTLRFLAIDFYLSFADTIVILHANIVDGDPGAMHSNDLAIIFHHHLDGEIRMSSRLKQRKRICWNTMDLPGAHFHSKKWNRRTHKFSKLSKVSMM